jgi:hypothetical protein
VDRAGVSFFGGTGSFDGYTPFVSGCEGASLRVCCSYEGSPEILLGSEAMVVVVEGTGSTGDGALRSSVVGAAVSSCCSFTIDPRGASADS